jgi:riboflavin biosynthesis pyrimidine reductase
MPPESPGRVRQLLPEPAIDLPVQGLYLDREVASLSPSDPSGPLVYGNFVTSLDGRIAIGEAETTSHVPRAISTRADWRLFQELQAHADAFITHGGYLRALARGQLGNILQVGLREDAADLLPWRRARGLDRQPVVIVASTSLAFTLPPSLGEHDQPVVIATTKRAPPDRVEAWREAGADVRVTGDSERVGARALVDIAAQFGCRRVYLQSGPQVLADMVRERLLGRLYLTISAQLVGGEHFHSLTDGDVLGPAGRLHLERIYHLAGDGETAPQLFTSYRGPAAGGAQSAG